MKVLVIPSWFVNSFSPLSGVFFKEQAEALAQNGIDVSLLAVNRISLKDINNKKRLPSCKIEQFSNKLVNYTTIEVPSLPKLPSLNAEIVFQLGKLLFKKTIEKYGKPDMVHLHSFLQGRLALWIKENYNIPYIITEHSTGFAREAYSPKMLSLAEKVFVNANTCIVVSTPFKKLMDHLFPIQFEVLPNVVDTNFFSLKTSEEQNKFTFLNVAFLEPKKNHLMLIDAFWSAFEHNSQVYLTIAGTGSQYSALKKHIEKIGAQGRVNLYGMASREEVKTLMHNSSAFALSSEFETFGVVLIEALSCGLPVIATKCGGPEDIVNVSLGELCEINSKSLSIAMCNLKERIKHDSFNGLELHEYINDRFSNQVVTLKILQLYKNS